MKKAGINMYIFILSICIGLFLIKIIPNYTKNIPVYPTPYNSKKIQYKDINDTCFQFEYEKVDCKKYNNINTIPIQS
tara:strand:+ start:1176 stop:1406 length:231 start_codon:yes stop_codon:yes gene_type:complete